MILESMQRTFSPPLSTFDFFSVKHNFKLYDTGFQHYDLGLIGTYSLNKLMGIPRRYGQWTANGYLYYTDGINEGLLARFELSGPDGPVDLPNKKLAGLLAYLACTAGVPTGSVRGCRCPRRG